MSAGIVRCLGIARLIPVLVTAVLASALAIAEPAVGGNRVNKVPEGFTKLVAVAQLAQSDPVLSVAWSADGQTLAAVGYADVQLWDVAAQKPLRHIETGLLTAKQVAITRDGRFIVTSGGSLAFRRAAAVWDAESGELVTSFGPPAGAVSLTIDARRELLAIALDPGFVCSIEIFDTKAWRLQQEFKCPKMIPERLAFAPDATKLAVGGAGGTIMLFDLEHGARLLWEIEGYEGYEANVAALAFSPDGQRLASGGGVQAAAVGLPNGEIRKIPPLPDSLRIWRVADGMADQTYQTAEAIDRGQPSGAMGRGMDWNSTGAAIAFASVNGDVRVWSVTEPAKAPLSAQLAALPFAAAFAPAGDLLAVATASGTTVLRLDREEP